MATTLTTSYKQIFSFKASTYATIKVFAKATQNTSANTSTISMYATLTGTGNSGSFSSGTLKYTLDGQTQSYSLGSTSYGGKTITYNTFTKTRSHASDGTYTNKTISVSISTTGSPNGSGSGTINCATIPRQNTITSVSEADIGSNINIVIGNNSSSFKNTVTWSCNGLSGTVVTTNGTTLDKVASGTYTWKIPTSILATIPNSSSATITLTNTTYSGTTQIGTTTTATTKANVPNSSRPTLSLVSKVETDESVINALPSSATNFTEPIINLSKPSFTFTARALDGATLNWLYLTTSSSTKAIQLSGTTQTITYTFENPMTSPIVTFDLFDSRGLTTNTPYTFDGTSLARTYDKPVFKTVEIERPNITYSTVEGKITGSYTVENIDGVTGNSVSLGYQYKEVNEENYSSIVWLENDITYNTTNGTWAYEGTMGSFAEYNKSYYVKLILGDQVVDSTIEYVFMLRKSIPTMSLGENDMQVNGELVVDSIRTKNMLNLGTFVSLTTNGVTFTNNNDGTITINGTASTDFGVRFTQFKIKAGNYYLSVNESATLPSPFYLYDFDTSTGHGSGAITLSRDYEQMGFDTWVTAGNSFNNITIAPQLEKGLVSTNFAPHQDLDLQIAKGSASVNWSYISATENNYWEKYGKVVVFHFTMTTTGTWDYTTNFLTNLPKPISYTRFIALDTSNNEPIRVAIDTNGNAYNAWSSVTPSSGHIIEGLATYITSE